MNLPNKITTVRMILMVILVILLLFPYDVFNIKIPQLSGGGFNVSVIYLIALIIFAIASFSDYLDGHLARKYNLVTTYGKFMDPIADKLLVNSTLIILATQGPLRIPTIVVVLMIARDIVVDAVRLLAVEKGKVIAASIWGKAKTVLQMIAIICIFLNDYPFSLLNLPFHISIVLCYLAMIASVVSGIIYVISARELFKEEKKND